MEAGLAAGTAASDLAEFRTAFETPVAPGEDLAARLRWCRGGAEAVAALEAYGDRLGLVCAAGTRLDLGAVGRLAAEAPPGPLVVDYLQKVAVPGDVPDEAERVTRVVEGLKDLALRTARPVVAVVASDRAGLGPATRTRLSHLRGSTALAYEADVALLLNGKHAIVSRQHLVYGGDADRFRSWVVCSVEKNRSGGSGLDLEFRAHLDHGYVDPHGGFVREALVDDRVHLE